MDGDWQDRFWLWLARYSDALQVLGFFVLVFLAVRPWIGGSRGELGPQGGTVIALVAILVGLVILRIQTRPSVSRKRAARLLVARLESATHDLLNETSTDGHKALRDRMHKWQETTLRLMDSLGPLVLEAEKSEFRTLVVYSPVGLSGVDEEHARVRNLLAEKILRVRDIARQIESRA
jgi:hypothetical protein